MVAGALKKGAEGADAAWAVAFRDDEVLNGTPVARQVEFRRARLLRHFAEIQRQTARGAFED